MVEGDDSQNKRQKMQQDNDDSPLSLASSSIVVYWVQ